MKFESKYLKKDISEKYKKGLPWALVSGPFLTIGLWAIYYGRILPESDRRLLGSLIHGIKVMPTNELVIAGLCGIPVAGLLVILGHVLHFRKKIIVSFDFDHDSKVLTVQTRQITKNRLKKLEIEYSNLKVGLASKIYDGISRWPFEGFELLNNGKHVGYLLKDHFTWNENQVAEISLELTKTGKAPDTDSQSLHQPSSRAK